MAEQRIQTARFGEISVDSDRVIHFVEPVLGFTGSKDYTLLDHAENSPFKWLQSVQDPELAFVVTNPQFFGIPYEFNLADDYASKLALTNAEDTLVLTIVNIPQGNPTHMTANLLGPIIINQQNRHAMQVILLDTKYETKTRLIPDASGTSTSTSAASTSS